MYLGIDFGTSGCRAIVIDAQRQIQAEASCPLPAPSRQQDQILQMPSIWLDGLWQLLDLLTTQYDLSQIKHLALDGTSGTVLLVNPSAGSALTPALMYNDASSHTQQQLIQQHCPDLQHIVNSASSGLAKALQLAQSQPPDTPYMVFNQADYLTNYLSTRHGFSDYHNALKMGYDLQQLTWPSWIFELLPRQALPVVKQPGEPFGTIKPKLAKRFGFSNQLQICAGTTDANAAFIATESTQPGDAVTSLGSTLVLKVLNQHPIQDVDCGVYSHKLGDYWLAGGASNAGGSVLRHFFTDQQLIEYSQQIDLTRPSGLDYYPLPGKGERFPTMEPEKQPILKPRPDSDILFLQGMLEGLSRIEKQGYDKLLQLGANPINQLQTLGGGSVNPQWQQMRSQLLGLPITQANHSEAAYGSALLALQGLSLYQCDS